MKETNRAVIPEKLRTEHLDEKMQEKSLSDFCKLTKAEADAKVLEKMGVDVDFPMEKSLMQDAKKISDYREFSMDIKLCNPNFEQGREYKINCQRCVPAYEMRCRGYDVTAFPRPQFDTSNLAYQPFDVWKNPEIIRCSGNGLADIQKNMAQWGDGTRAQVVVTWKNVPSGHTFTAEQVNGRTIFYDPQTGATNVQKYFDRVEPGSVRFCRIDNQDISDKILYCCKKETKL